MRITNIAVVYLIELNMTNVIISMYILMTKFKNLEYVLHKINNRNVYCIIENRPKKFMFGGLNYGEIPNFINKADGDPWDILAPGYSKLLPKYKPLKITEIIGVFKLENDNDKIIVKVDIPGFDEKLMYSELVRYMKNYIVFTKVKGKFYKFVQ